MSDTYFVNFNNEFIDAIDDLEECLVYIVRDHNQMVSSLVTETNDFHIYEINKNRIENFESNISKLNDTLSKLKELKHLMFLLNKYGKEVD